MELAQLAALRTIGDCRACMEISSNARHVKETLLNDQQSRGDRFVIVARFENEVVLFTAVLDMN